jgi:hypothetical protein
MVAQVLKRLCSCVAPVCDVGADKASVRVVDGIIPVLKLYPSARFRAAKESEMLVYIRSA